MAEVIITVTKDGKTTVKVEGHMGPSCSLKSQPYRDALGITIDDTPPADALATNTEDPRARP